MRSTPTSAAAKPHLTTRPPAKLLSVEQTLAMLGIGRTNFYHLRATNALATIKLGRRTFVRSDDLDAFVAALSDEPAK